MQGAFRWVKNRYPVLLGYLKSVMWSGPGLIGALMILHIILVERDIVCAGVFMPLEDKVIVHLVDDDQVAGEIGRAHV